MRNRHKTVIAIGVGREFAAAYSGALKRAGFELGAGPSPRDAQGDAQGDAPLLLVHAPGLTKSDKARLAGLTSPRKKLPIILLSDGGDAVPPALARAAARVLAARPTRKALTDALRELSASVSAREEAATLRGSLKKKEGELASVLAITRLLTSSFDLDRVLGRIMERVRGMVKAQGWAVLLANEYDQELLFSYTGKRGAQRAERYRLKIGEGIAGWAASERAPRVVNDVSKAPRFSRVLDKVTGVKTRSVMAVPVISKDRLMGVVELVNKDAPGGFTEEDLKLVTMLMDQTAFAIERAQMFQKMEDLVITDDLTKLFNLRYLERTLDVELERAERYSLSLSLIFMDLDYFKNVNDRYGHLVGSKLLVEVSQLLLQGLRKVDIVARYGGDEFVIVLPQTDVKAARMIAERLRRSMEKNVFLKSQNLAISMTASFGIACYPDHATSEEELMRLADEAMYRVKYQTRNDVYVVGS